MRKTLSLLALLTVVSCAPLFSQALPGEDSGTAVVGEKNKEKKEPSKKISFEISAGSFTFPGLLFGMDGSLATHPDKLSGYMTSFSVNYRFGQSGWSLGPRFSRISASGSGKWARSDTQARLDTEGVDGITTGDLDIRIYEIAAVARKEFSKGFFRPYIEFGGGAGVLKYDFRGHFDGHETQSGFDSPVTEPARDRARRLIPVFIFEPGIKLEKKGFTCSVGPYWNTGLGIRTSCGLKF